MFELTQLIEERDKIMLACLNDLQADFSRLRKICHDFNDRCVAEKVFETDGTDQQLWESVTAYFQRLLKKS